MKNIILTICALCACQALAQVEDDFSDGELLNDPQWFGDHPSFRVNEDHQLQLDADGAGMAYLSTALGTYGGTEWRCWIRLGFSPSANNNARLYLVSDHQDLGVPLNGYYLQLGEAGADDAICLYRQEEDNDVLVCRGRDGLISSSFIIGIRVLYDNGQWTVFADPSGGDDYQPEAYGDSEWLPVSGFMGIACKFTSSNSKKFYFDDVYAGPVIVDNVPPLVMNIDAERYDLVLAFSESLDRPSAENEAHYHLDQGMGAPDSAVLDEGNRSLVRLHFEGGLANGTNYTLTVNGICDLSGNCLQDTGLSFSYFIPQPFDIVINEIMADPVPAVGLPEHEYLELHNLSGFPVSLDGWTLTIGSSDKLIEDASVDAGAYLILCKQNAAFEMSFWGPVHALSTLSLTNAGQIISLRDQQGRLISQVKYDESWYGNDEKAEGGWSLELVNPHDPCAGTGNWKASVHMEGGTPGAMNSTYDELYIPVIVDKACHVNDSTFELCFNQLMDTSALKRLESYDLDHGVGHPVRASFDGDMPDKVAITFDRPLQKGTVYSLTVNDWQQNCVGWPLLAEEPLKLGIPEEAGYNDVVINEILFNPLAGGEDYLEIYNRSEKITDLYGMMLLSIKSSFPDPDDTLARPVSGSCFLFFPGEYILLSKDEKTIREYYYTSNPGAFIDMPSFPPYNNEEGRAALVNAEGGLIDRFHYTEDMHHPLLNSVEGVALERVHYDLPAGDPANWHSAAAQAGYGTPGYQNSQFLVARPQNTAVYLEPQVIFPGDYSGGGASLGIHYHFERPGNTSNVLIFNSQGYLVRKLVQNEIIGTSGMFVWDGLDDRRLMASPGIYIVMVEVFDIRGNVGKYKMAAVVGQR